MNFKVGDKVRVLTIPELQQRGISVKHKADGFLVVDGWIIYPTMKTIMGKVCTVIRDTSEDFIPALLMCGNKSAENKYYVPICMIEPADCVTISPVMSFDSLFGGGDPR